MLGRDPRISAILARTEQEHSLLDDGAYDALSELVSERVALVEGLAGHPIESNELMILQGEMTRIGHRLEAARAGVARARRRMLALSQTQFSTYTRDSVITHTEPTRRTSRAV
jgi:hypothetical protein